ncbi:MAG: OmpA family protein [Saprospiraceae bacterium]|nr:OmpA family protein [Saprospiraceae bacterium]
MMDIEAKYTGSFRRQLIFGMAAVQIAGILAMMLLLSRCNAPSKEPKAGEAGVVDSTVLASPTEDTLYVPIAKHHTPEAAQVLRDLEQKQFESGTLAHQLLDYLKRGDNDFGDEFKFIDLHFDFRSPKPMPNSRLHHEIDDLAQLMTAWPALRIKLMVYTDSDGEEKANEKLAQQRGEFIIAKLAEKGIDQSRIELKAFGEKYPVADNKSLEGRLINNRIELMVLSK